MAANDETEDELEAIYPGDRIGIEWVSPRSTAETVTATGTARDHEDAALYIEPDDRDRDLAVATPSNGGEYLVRSIGREDNIRLGELVSVDVRQRGEASLRANPRTDPETTPDLDDGLETLVLVGCGDAKADERSAARDLYTSNYFGLKRQYAEEIGDDWAILSAEYGLLDPDAEIEPYDTTIDDVDTHEWEIDVLGALPNINGTRVVLLAGPDYIEDLEDDLFMYGGDVETPTDGMRIGERMSWLSEHADDEIETDGAGEEDEEIEDVSPVIEPTPPSTAPAYVLDGLDKQSPETLRELASYADRLAEYKEAVAERELEERAADVDDDEIPDDWEADEWDDVLEDVDEAPRSATLTTKTIDGRDYFYYQWRDGDSIKSEYVAPVTPAGSDN